MAVNDINWTGLSAGTGLNRGLTMGSNLAQIGRQNRLEDEQLELAETQRQIDDAARDALSIKSAGDMNLKREILMRRIQQGEAQGRDMSDSRALLALPDNEFNLEIDRVISQALPVSSLAGYSSSAGQREFESMIKNLTPEEQERARRIKLGLDPRAVGSGAITTATQNLTDQVAESEAEIAGAKASATEESKLTEQRKYMPQIKAAIKTAEQEAESRGEKLSELGKAEASIPFLKEAVAELRDLATIATSTVGGRIYDEAVKQTGFGATKGATARAKYIAIVDNQVLPLLKQTFGAAFTVKEMESLRATMGDPDASTVEKQAQLDAFIEQKLRDLEMKRQEAAPFMDGSPAQNRIRFDAQGNIIQ